WLARQIRWSATADVDKPSRGSHRARHEEEKAGGRSLIFISTEPVSMNNKLPCRGENFLWLFNTMSGFELNSRLKSESQV
ncbi:MAG: hypothetical protein ACLFP9_09345, partial [Desulfonatronovibrio sp.]